jgi:hypothetical protein
MLNLNSRIISQSTQAVKFCLHCGEGNYQDLGQCVSCKRTRFVSEAEFEKERNVGKQEMIVGSLFFLFWLALLFLRLNINVNNSVPKFVSVPFVLLGLFIAIDGAYKFQHGRRSMILNIILGACVVAILAVGFYYELL